MYTTLALIKQEMRANKVTEQSGEDLLIMSYLRAVENRIVGLGFDFAPRYQQRSFDSFPRFVNSTLNTYDLRRFIMLPTAISVGGTAYVWGTDIVGYPDYSPFRYLRFTADPCSSSISWYPSRGTYFSAIGNVVVTGYWGYRRDYSNAWLDSNDTVEDNPLSSSATTITVNDADGADAWSRTPRFSPGNLIRFEDGVSNVYEFAEVTAVDTTLNTLTVRRGQRGTTATAHVQNTGITLWTAEPEIERVATRQAAMMYARRGAFQVAEINPEGVTLQYPQDLLTELYNTIDSFNYQEQDQ